MSTIVLKNVAQTMNWLVCDSETDAVLLTSLSTSIMKREIHVPVF